MRFRVLLVLGLVAFPLSGARLGKLELTVLPRSGGKILVDVRGEVEEATPSAPLTILHLEGLRHPVVKFHSPDDWRWQRRVDAVSLQVAVPRGAHEFSLQVEALPTGALRVLSDLPARTVRVFLPEGWDFPAEAVDRMKFGRRMLAVYEIPGTFPVVIPLGKGKPILFFLIAGGVFLLALGVGSILFFRRRHPTPVPVEPEVEEVFEEPVEVEPEEETVEELPEVIEPSVAVSSQEPSTLTDPFVGLGAPQTPEEKPGEGTEEVVPAMPEAELPAAVELPGEEEPESEDERLRKLAREVGIPAEGFPPEPSLGEEEKGVLPEPSSLLEEEEGPVSIEEQLLAEQGEARSIEAELLEGSPSPAGFLPEEKSSPSPPEEPEEESGLFAGMTPGETRVEASPTDMLEMGDLPVEEAEASEPDAEAPAPGDEEDLRVEVDEAFLAGAREYGGEAEPAGPTSAEEPSSPPSPEPGPPSGSGAPVSPEPAEPPAPPPPPPRQLPPSRTPSPPASSAPGPEEEPAPRSEKEPSPPPPPPAPRPEPSPGPASPKKPPRPESSSPAPPPPPPGRTPPAPPKKPAGASPKDREALIREWLLKRKRKKRS